MKNVIYEICDKLRGYSTDEEYFEVLGVTRTGKGLYTVEVAVIEPQTENDEGAENDRNE